MFAQIKEFQSFEDTIIVLISTTMGQWDFSIYKELGELQSVGVAFHILVILINKILLLNLVIAILQQTYIELSKM